MTIIAFITLVLVLIYFAVWLWGMWIAFTQGDDRIAKFGRRLFARLLGQRVHTKNSKGYLWRDEYFVTEGFADKDTIIWIDK